MPPTSRTSRIVRDAKAKHRTDIRPEEWGKQKYAKIWNDARSKLVEECSAADLQQIERVKGSVSREEFVRRFEQPHRRGRPCILSGLCDEWRAMKRWAWKSLREDYGEDLFKCGEDDDGKTIRMKMKHFLRYMASSDKDGARQDDSPLYIFESRLSRDMLSDYTIPHLFSEDLFQHVGESRRPPHRWFLIGPERSGTTVHIDPLGTSAWNALISGVKLWAVFPPRCPKKLVKAKSLFKKRHNGAADDEAVDYFVKIFAEMKEELYRHDSTLKGQIMLFLQHPGETVFLPGGWWHAVLNLSDSCAVTQNYCSTGNFPRVWRVTRTGRKKMAVKWLSKLEPLRPDLFKLAHDINKADGFVPRV